MNSFDLLRPKTLKDAVASIRAANPPVIKAGGVDLLDRMKEGIARPTRLLDILPLAELRGIKEEGGAIKIGALTTLAEVAASELIRSKAAALAEAALEAATPQIRAQATVGGNLFQHNRCWYYRSADFEPCWMRGGKGCPAKDGRNKIHAVFDTDADCVAVDPSNLAASLGALGATVTQLKLEEPGQVAFTGRAEDMLVHGRNTLDGTTGWNGLLQLVTVPVAPARRSAYRELGERESFDWALASAAVSFDWKDGACSAPRIFLGAVALHVRRCEDAEKMLDGKKLTPELARAVAAKALEGAKPLAENGYKVPVARTLVARALLAAAGMEEKK